MDPRFAELAGTIKLITFDCYGTLIDWEAGMASVLKRTSGASDDAVAEMITAYIRREASVEQQAYQSYREVQAATLRSLAANYGFAVPLDDADALSEALPDWPPFPDTVAALKRLKKRYQLGILSNIDRDLFAQTARQLEVKFDLVITAQDVQAYKPAMPHFLRMLETTGLERGQVLHAAQSLYHDARPAEQLGIPFVWINRYGQSQPATTPMVASFGTLAELADALGV